MNRSVPLVVLTVAAVTPPVAAPWIAVATAGAATATVKSRLVYGPSVNMRWGPVQVRIRVKGKRFTNIGTSAPTERPKSARINQQAVPILRQETLKAQSARIFVVSGATMTSNAFGASLQAAIKKAHV